MAIGAAPRGVTVKGSRVDDDRPKPEDSNDDVDDLFDTTNNVSDEPDEEPDDDDAGEGNDESDESDAGSDNQDDSELEDEPDESEESEEEDDDSDDEDEEEVEDDEEEEDDRDRIIRELREELAKAHTPASETSKTEEKKEEKDDDTPAPTFGDDIFTKEEIEALNTDPSKIGELLAKGFSRISAGMMKELPTVLANSVTRQAAVTSSVTEFYKNNPELAPFKPVMARTVQQVESEHPEYSPNQLLEEASKRVRALMRLETKAADTEAGRQKKKRTSKGKGSKAAFAGRSKGGKSNAGKGRKQPKGTAAEVDELLS